MLLDSPIERRALLRIAGQSAAASLLRPALELRPRLRLLPLSETYVAGTRYYRAAEVRGLLRPGDALRLRREPLNPYDDLAIEVLTAEGAKLGYVPRVHNAPFSRLIDAGYTVLATAGRLRPGEWGDIGLRLGLLAVPPGG